MYYKIAAAWNLYFAFHDWLAVNIIFKIVGLLDIVNVFIKIYL
jgi:hypothetical protein